MRATTTAATTTTDREALRRARAFERARLRAACQRVVEHPLGEALFHDGLPLVWMINELALGAEETSAPEVVVALDELYGHLPHRRAMIEHPELAVRLGEELRRDGWVAQRNVYMVLRGERDRPPAPELAREADADELRAVAAQTLAEDRDREPALVEQLLTARGLLGRAGRARYFVAAADGVDASHATLYSDGVVAQVEDVATLDAFRGRGLARAACSAAVDAALQAGHELVFIIADDDDWPKQLYAKLGFEPVGTPWCLTLPARDTPAPPT